MFEKILVAVDGSTHSQNAARIVGDIAKTYGVKKIYMVVVFEPIPTYLGEPNLQVVIDARMTEANQILAGGLAILGQVPCEVITEILEGPSADAIIEVAATRSVDLIVLGSRGRGQLAGLLLGSTSQKVVGHAHCPVLVTR